MAIKLSPLPTVLVSLHLFKMMTHFRNVDFASGLPIVNVDFIQYYARALRASAFFDQSGRFWGYDPFLMGGYVSGLYNAVGNYFINIVSSLLSPLVSISTSVLLIEIGGFVLAPFCMLIMAKGLGWDKRTSWILFGLSVVGFLHLEGLSQLHGRVGLFGFQMAAFVSFAQVGLMWHWFKIKKNATLIGLVLCTSLAFQMHPSSLLIILIPNVILFGIHARRLNWKQHGQLGLALLCVLAFNWYWIQPFLAFYSWRTSASYFVTQGFTDFLDLSSFKEYWIFGLSKFVFQILVVGFSITSLYGWVKKQKDIFVLFGSWLLVLALISFFGSKLPLIKTLQPGRLLFPLWILLYVCAAPSVAKVAQSKVFLQRTFSYLFVFLMWLFFTDRVTKPYSYIDPLTTTLKPFQQDLIDYLKENPIEGSRLYIETRDDGSPHVADYIPFLTGTPLAGAPHPGTHMITRFTRLSGGYMQGPDFYQDPIFFGKELERMSLDQVKNYIYLYNVGLIAVRSESLKSALDLFPTAIRYDGFMGGHHLYRPKQKGSYFLEGSGEIYFDFDRIILKNPSLGRLILKFHWIKSLQASEATHIKPVLVEDIPVPFIEIYNRSNAKEIHIYNAGL